MSALAVAGASFAEVPHYRLIALPTHYNGMVFAAVRMSESGLIAGILRDGTQGISRPVLYDHRQGFEMIADGGWRWHTEIGGVRDDGLISFSSKGRRFNDRYQTFVGGRNRSLITAEEIDNTLTYYAQTMSPGGLTSGEFAPADYTDTFGSIGWNDRGEIIGLEMGLWVDFEDSGRAVGQRFDSRAVYRDPGGALQVIPADGSSSSIVMKTMANGELAVSHRYDNGDQVVRLWTEGFLSSREIWRSNSRTVIMNAHGLGYMFRSPSMTAEEQELFSLDGGAVCLQDRLSSSDFDLLQGRRISFRDFRDTGSALVGAIGPADTPQYILEPVPEPSTLAALALGGTLLLRRRLRRTR